MTACVTASPLSAQSIALWQATVDALSSSLAILDGTGTIVAVNASWRSASALGDLSIRAEIGHSYLTACDHAAASGIPGASDLGDGIRAVLGGDAESVDVGYPSHTERAERWYNARISTVADAGDLRVMVVHDDATAYRLAERRLRVSADFMTTVAQAMADGLYVLDESGRLTFMNHAAETMLGWASAELEGELLHDVIHAVHPDGSPHPFASCPITVARASNEAVHVDSDVFAHRGGAVFPVSYSSVPFETEHGERGSVVVFEDITERLARERKVEADLRALDTVSRIRAALRDRRMVLFAQPIVCLDTGRTVQHELLIRMRSESGDLVPPGEFLPVAEAYGLIREIDRYVIREAMAFAGAGHPIELNLSADSLSDPSLLHFVEGELAAFSVDPSVVVFEITETALMANEASAFDFVSGVVELGCAVALDDFGTGYGGFHYLKRLPVEYLKIDREFVTEIHLGGANQHVVEAIVSLARGMGQLTIAEGVEDPETLSRLRELGVDQVQGWALGRPAPIETVYASRATRLT